MSTPTVTVFNAGEQILSSDLNQAESFAGQELSDMLLRLFAVDQQGFTGSPPNPLGTGAGGMLSGFDIAIVGGLTFAVNPGQAFRQNPAAPLGQSSWRWIRLVSAAQETVVAPVAPGTNWYLVAITDAMTSTAPTSRNVFDETAQQVNAEPIVKSTSPSGVLALLGPFATAALAAAALPAGSIPTGFIGVPFGTTVLTADMVVDGRVMLQVGAYSRHGILSGLTIALQAADQLTIGQGYGWAGGFPVRSGADIVWGLADIRYADALSQSLGTVGAANQTLYCYLVPNGAGAAVVSNGSPTVLSTDGSGYALVVSSVAPTAGSIPSAAWPAALLAYGAAPTHLGPMIVPKFRVGTQTLPCALFVGQITTDAGGHIKTAAS